MALRPPVPPLYSAKSSFFPDKFFQGQIFLHSLSISAQFCFPFLQNYSNISTKILKTSKLLKPINNVFLFPQGASLSDALGRLSPLFSSERLRSLDTTSSGVVPLSYVGTRPPNVHGVTCGGPSALSIEDISHPWLPSCLLVMDSPPLKAPLQPLTLKCWNVSGSSPYTSCFMCGLETWATSVDALILCWARPVSDANIQEGWEQGPWDLPPGFFPIFYEYI